MKISKLGFAAVLASMAQTAAVYGQGDPRTLEGAGASYDRSQNNPGEDLAKIDQGPDGAAASYTQDGLVAMTSDQLDAIYARLTSGPIPEGFYRGKVMIPPDRGLDVVKPILGGSAPSIQAVRNFAQQLWSGKYFDRKRRVLQNRINLEGGATTGNATPTSVNDKNMLFPAKLYCGQSMFDSRRESIIIDYKYGEEDWPSDLTTDAATETQRKNLNWVAGPRGLLIRDEIRMVKPGLYLGRAYMQGVFGLYFILQYDQASGGQDPAQLAQQVGDECWIGHQRQLQAGKNQSDYVNN